jgi:hypothetical protein
MALAITDTFEEVVLKSDKPVMVDFGHGVVLVEWLDQLLMSYTEYDGKVVVKSGCGCKPRICSKIW